MKGSTIRWPAVLGALGAAALVASALVMHAAPPDPATPSSSATAFAETMKKMSEARPGIMKASAQFLAERYDLSDRPAKGVTMSRGKAVQEGVRAKLPPGVTWDQLAAMSPAEVKAKNLWPAGFLPLPHPNHPEGGMIFPKFHDRRRQEADGSGPDPVRPRLRPPRHRAARVPAGDLPHDAPRAGRRVAGQARHARELLEHLRRHPQSQATRGAPAAASRRSRSSSSMRPTTGARPGPAWASRASTVTSTATPTAPTHLVGDIRPQALRHRIETPTLRGVNIQRLFGSQRALKSVEDFTEFEQRAAYFDGDPVMATKKGVNILERGSQVHFMAEFQELLDFPPAPRLGIDGKLDPALGHAPGDAGPGSLLR